MPLDGLEGNFEYHLRAPEDELRSFNSCFSLDVSNHPGGVLWYKPPHVVVEEILRGAQCLIKTTSTTLNCCADYLIAVTVWLVQNSSGSSPLACSFHVKNQVAALHSQVHRDAFHLWGVW